MGHNASSIFDLNLYVCRSLQLCAWAGSCNVPHVRELLHGCHGQYHFQCSRSSSETVSVWGNCADKCDVSVTKYMELIRWTIRRLFYHSSFLRPGAYVGPGIYYSPWTAGLWLHECLLENWEARNCTETHFQHYIKYSTYGHHDWGLWTGLIKTFTQCFKCY